MVSLPAYAFLVASLVLVLHPWHGTSDVFSPIIGKLACNMMRCGKGTCKPSGNSTLGFVCECDKGWKQVSIPQFHEEQLGFLPCLIPNCTLNSTCITEEVTFSPPTVQPNTSNFNPCHWTNCGGGTCNKTTLFNYRCECQKGYNNMLQNSMFPCYKECAFSNDCSMLGVNISDAWSSKQSSMATSTLNHGNNWLVSKALCALAMVAAWL